MKLRDLTELLKNMQPQLRGEFLICSMPPELVTGDLIAGAMSVFKEREGITLIVPEASRKNLPKHAKASVPHVLIMLNVTNDPEKNVGFLATITGALANEEISLYAVSAFYHDYLFVPRDKAEKAMAMLAAMAKQL